MSISTQNLVEQFRKQPPIQQKAIGTILSFLLSLGIFITIRVVGVIYYKEVFIDLVNFDPISALNLIVWLGIVALFIIAFAMLNFTIESDKTKLNLDVISAAVISLGFYWLISYNYIGFNYSYLLFDMSVAERLFNWAYFISIFAVYGSTDLFLFWLGVSGVFHIVFFIFASVDLEGKLFVAFERTKARQKSAPESPLLGNGRSVYGTKDAFLLTIISMIVSIIVLFIPFWFLNEKLVSELFSLSGITLLAITCLLEVMFYVFSKRIRNRKLGVVFYLFVAVTFTAINLFFLILQNVVAGIVLVIVASVVVLIVSNSVVKK